MGLADVAELGVVVVLDDPRVVGTGPVDECEPALERHRVAERELVRRGHDGEAGVRFEVDAGRDVEPGLIDRHRDDASTGGNQCGAGAEVAGVLEPGGVARVEQYPRAELQRLL